MYGMTREKDAQQQGGATGSDTKSRDALDGTAADQLQELALALRERNLQEFFCQLHA